MATNPFLDDTPAPAATPNPFLQGDPANHAAAPHKVEQPKNARPNPLRTVLDAMDVPLAALQAFGSDAGHAIQKHDLGFFLAPLSPNPMPVGQHAKTFFQDLTHGGPHAVAENDVYPRMGSLQRVLNDPTASHAAKHAAHILQNTPALASALDFGQEWFNPSNYGVGEAARLLGPLVRGARAVSPEIDTAARGAEYARASARNAVAKAVPKVARAVSRVAPVAGLRELVDRYQAAGLPQRGGMPYVTAALATQAAPEHAAAVATTRIRSMFDGLTTAQKREVQKLSYVDANGERFATRDTAVPEPKKGPSLEDRAVQVRQMLLDLDRRQEALGIRTRSKVVMPRGKNPNAQPKVVSGDLSNSGTFFPMRQFGEQPVFQSQDLAAAAQNAQDENALTNAISRRVGRGRSKFSSGVTNAGHKVKRDLPDILNPEVEADLHPEYDPAFQLERHVGETERAIANEQAKLNLETLPSVDPETGVQRTTNIPGVGDAGLYARMPLQYYLEPNARRPLAMIFGQGETGRRGMETYIKRAAQARAQQMARGDQQVLDLAQQHGIDVNRLGRSIRNANLAPLKARMAEVQKAGRGAGRLAQNVAGIAGRAKSELTGRAQDLAMRAEQLGNEADAAASIPKAKIPKGMEADAAAAAQAHNAARNAALNPVPIARADAAADEAAMAARTAAHGFDRVAAEANGLSDKSAERLANLNASFAERAAKAETAAAFQKAVNHYYSDAFEEVAKNIRKEATHAPGGYVKESDLGLASQSGRDMAIDEAFARFLKDQHVNPEQTEIAKKFWRTMDVLNRLARLSIVLIPTVHGVNNLGMAYLAEGGNPLTMAEILAGKKAFSDELKQRAYDAGAATDWSQRTFSLGEEGAHATTDIGEHAAMIGKRAGAFSKVVTPAAKAGLHAERLYNRMNDWLFRQAEQGYAFDLFDKFTRQGMTDGEAALRVRNALGRYDNISPMELKYAANRIFYFYPWMKTAVAFWAKKGVMDPKWWTAPVAGIRTNNEQQGYDDPSKPFTMTLGKRFNGQQWRRFTLPVPQRVLENEAELARVPLDLVQNDWNATGQDLKAPLNYVVGHFNPFIQTGLDAIDLVRQGEQRVAPWNTFKVQPGQNGNLTVAGNFLGRMLSPFARVEQGLQDPAAGAAAYLSGAFSYGVPTHGEQGREKMIRQRIDAQYHPAIAAATARGDASAVQRLTALREAAIQRAISGGSAPGAPAAEATPAASANPFLSP